MDVVYLLRNTRKVFFAVSFVVLPLAPKVSVTDEMMQKKRKICIGALCIYLDIL